MAEETDERLASPKKAKRYPASTARVKVNDELQVDPEISNDDVISAYPNPIGGTTKIIVNLPREGDALVSVNGRLGNRIITLHKGKLAGGRHEFPLNTEGFSSGLYTYSIVFEGKRITKKLVKP